MTYVGRLVHQLVSEKVGGTSRTTRTKETSVSVAEAGEKLQAIFRQMWAPRTLSDRQNLWRRLHQWASAQGLSLNADTASLFAMATGVRPQGTLAYTKALSAIFGKMGLDNKPLLATASALRAAGAMIPQSQDRPIPREVLLRWAASQEPRIRLGAWVAWKTASRWGEVWQLRSDQFILATPEEVIIDWWTLPKARRGDPFRESRYVVIRGELTKEISELVRELSPFEALCPNLNTEGLDNLWSSDPAMQDYRAHSIKRGATTHLMELMSDGVEIDGDVVDRLTKHAARSEKLSRQTLRYGGNCIAMARVLETGKATMHL